MDQIESDVWLSRCQRSYLVKGSCDQQGGSPQELFVDAPGVPVLDKPEAVQVPVPVRTAKIHMTALEFSDRLQCVQGKTVAATLRHEGSYDAPYSCSMGLMTVLPSV